MNLICRNPRQIPRYIMGGGLRVFEQKLFVQLEDDCM